MKCSGLSSYFPFHRVEKSIESRAGAWAENPLYFMLDVIARLLSTEILILNFSVVFHTKFWMVQKSVNTILNWRLVVVWIEDLCLLAPKAQFSKNQLGLWGFAVKFEMPQSTVAEKLCLKNSYFKNWLSKISNFNWLKVKIEKLPSKVAVNFWIN